MSTTVSDARSMVSATTLQDRLHGVLAATPWWVISLVFHFAILTFAYFYTWEVPLPKEEVILKPEIVEQKFELPPVAWELPRPVTEEQKVTTTRPTEVRKVQLSQKELPQLRDILGKPGKPKSGLSVLAAPGGVMRVGSIGEGEGFQISGDLEGAIGDMTGWPRWRERCLAVWLFDESKSMKPHQQLVRQKVDELYESLGINFGDSAEKRRIVTAVTSYGKEFHIELQEPTTDMEKIREAINKVPIDPSGVENFLNGINHVLAEYSKYAQKYSRSIVVIMVTDEAGDDDTKWEDGPQSPLELTVIRMKQMKASLLVFGYESGAFGYPHEQTYDPTVAKGYSPYATVNRGLDAAFSEMFPHDYYFRETDRVPSGFGPYGASRIARETGGIYYLLRASSAKSYDYQKLLSGYQPELASRVEISVRNKRNPLRHAIMGVIDAWTEVRNKENNRFQTVFPNNDSLKREVESTAKVVDEWILLVNDAIKRLKALGNVNVEDSAKRWDADRDLMWAQLHKLRFQLYQYRFSLDDLVHGRNIPPPGDIGWCIAYWASPSLRGDNMDEVLAEKKRIEDMYQIVIDKHVATPWEVFAKSEMRHLHGYAIIPYSRSRGGSSPPSENR